LQLLSVISQTPLWGQNSFSYEIATAKLAHVTDSLAATIEHVHQLSRRVASWDDRIRGKAVPPDGADKLAELREALLRPAHLTQQTEERMRPRPLVITRQSAESTRPTQQLTSTDLTFTLPQWVHALWNWPEHLRIPENLAQPTAGKRRNYMLPALIDSPHLQPQQNLDALYSRARSTISFSQILASDSPPDGTAALRQNPFLIRGAEVSLTATFKAAERAMRQFTGFAMTAFIRKRAQSWSELGGLRHVDTPQVWNEAKSRGGKFQEFEGAPFFAIPSLKSNLRLLGLYARWSGTADPVARRWELFPHSALVAKLSARRVSGNSDNVNHIGESLNGSAANILNALQLRMWPAIHPATVAAGTLAQKIGRFGGYTYPPVGGALRLTLHKVFGQRIKPAPVSFVVLRAASPVTSPPSVKIMPPDPPPVSINYAPVINGTGLDQHSLLEVLERHAQDLYRIISRHHERRERLRFK
jgi:hypothetical protein